MRTTFAPYWGFIHEDGQVCATEHCDVFAAGLNLEGHILKE